MRPFGLGCSTIKGWATLDRSQTPYLCVKTMMKKPFGISTRFSALSPCICGDILARYNKREGLDVGTNQSFTYQMSIDPIQWNQERIC